MMKTSTSKRPSQSSPLVWRVFLCLHFVCLVFCIGVAVFVLAVSQMNIEPIPKVREPCHETYSEQTEIFPELPISKSTVGPVEPPLPTYPHRVRPSDPGEYVTFGIGLMDGRGIGNQLFCFAIVIYIADLTGRKPCRQSFIRPLGLDDVFNLNLMEFDDIKPTYDYRQVKSSHKYDIGVEDVARLDHPYTKNRSLVMYGFYQSWKYVHTVDRRLREQHLRFRPTLIKSTKEFFHENVPPSWMKNFIRVGIHVRRGDIMSASNVQFGYTTPNETYFERSMDYFIKRYPRVQFIVCSNDITWVMEHIVQGLYSSMSVHITYAVNTSREQDFAILSHCDHVIMSTGTFGWWAAWMAKGTTIFYKNWPTPNSELAQWFIFEDYFPVNWIGMD